MKGKKLKYSAKSRERLRRAATEAAPKVDSCPGMAPGSHLPSHPLAMSLDAAVPLWILQLEQKGGPDPMDLKEAGEFSQVLGERGDVLLFKSAGKPGEAAGLFNRLARSVAVLAFCPGGVKVFGRHWEGRRST